MDTTEKALLAICIVSIYIISNVISLSSTDGNNIDSLHEGLHLVTFINNEHIYFKSSNKDGNIIHKEDMRCDCFNLEVGDVVKVKYRIYFNGLFYWKYSISRANVDQLKEYNYLEKE